MEAVRHSHTVNVWAVKPKQCAKMLCRAADLDDRILSDFSASISCFHITQSNLIYGYYIKNAGLRRDT